MVLIADDMLVKRKTKIPTYGTTRSQADKHRTNTVTESKILSFRSQWSGGVIASCPETDLVWPWRPVPEVKHMLWPAGFCHSKTQYELITLVQRILHGSSKHKTNRINNMYIFMV